MTAFVAAPALSAARAVRRRTPRAVACPQACNVQQIGSTGFYRAQQVKCGAAGSATPCRTARGGRTPTLAPSLPPSL